jgi:protein phosphatase
MFDNVTHVEKSQIGLLKSRNDDSFFIVDSSCTHYDLQRFGMIFVIADGLGGHAAGHVASKMACEEVVSEYYRKDATFQENMATDVLKLRRLQQTLGVVHKKIVALASANEGLRGMGTTLSALVLTDHDALIAHVGDSRIYRLRNDRCERMTIDHTKRQSFIDIGQIQPEQESNHHYGRIVTQALGGYDDLTEIFTRVEPVQRGDVFLLCTDGLHDVLSDREILTIMTENNRPHNACDELIEAAITKGGDDDITVVVIRV